MTVVSSVVVVVSVSDGVVPVVSVTVVAVFVVVKAKFDQNIYFFSLQTIFMVKNVYGNLQERGSMCYRH